jgi:hypothetical protein
VLTIQTLLQRKIFGNHLSACRPLDYRGAEWKELSRGGRERAVRLILKAILGVPSAHLGEQEHALWCFQFPKGSILSVYIHRGTVAEISVRREDEKEIEEAVDFLIAEVSQRLKQL